MFREFLRLIFSLVRSPLLLLIAVIGIAANSLIVAWLSDPATILLAEIIYSPLMGGQSGDLFFLYHTYASEINWLLLGWFLSLVVNSWVALAFARFAAKQQLRKTEVFESLGFSISKLKLVFSWSALVFVLTIFFVLLFGTALWLGGIHWIVLILLLLVFFAITIPSAMVLAFGLPVIGIEDFSIKEGLRTSGGFVSRHFVGVVFFMLLLGIFLGVVNLIGSTIADSLADENMVLAIVVLFWLIQTVFSNLALPFFYLSGESKKK